MGNTKTIGALIVTLAWTVPAAAKDSASLGISTDADYVPSARGTVTGPAAGEKYMYRGAGADATLLLPIPLTWHNIGFGTGIYGEVRSLTNTYQEPADPTATANQGKAHLESGKETVLVEGAGLLATANLAGNFQFLFGIGGAAATIKQTGDTPLTQTFTGLTVKLGFGFGPLPGASGVYGRLEPEEVLLSGGKEQGSPGKTLTSVTYVVNNIVLGYTVGFF